MQPSDVKVNVTFNEVPKEEPTYTVSKEGTATGYTISPESAKEGDDVQITGITVPENQMAVVTAKDTSADGKTVEVKDNGDHTYTFTMPASNVSVSVEYETVFTEGKYTINGETKAYKDSLTDRTQAFGTKFYNQSNGATNANGEFGGESGLDDQGQWWFDLIMSGSIQGKTVKSVTIDGEDIFDKNTIDISVGNDNHVKSKDCIQVGDKIRLSYLFVMTHAVNEEGKLVFDVAFDGMSTVKAALDMGQLTANLSCNGVVVQYPDVVTGELSDDKKTCTIFLDSKLEWKQYKSLIGIKLNNETNMSDSKVYYFTEKKYMKGGEEVSKGYGFTGQDTIKSDKVLGLYIPTPDKEWSYDSIQYKIITPDRKTLNTELLIQWHTKVATSNEGGES